MIYYSLNYSANYNSSNNKKEANQKLIHLFSYYVINYLKYITNFLANIYTL